MKFFLFLTSILFSVNAFSAPAITLNGLSWTHLAGDDSIDPRQDFSDGWRWANQSEVNQFISDFYNVDYSSRYNNVNLTGSFFDYFNPNVYESGSIGLIFFSSDLVSNINGAINYGGGGFNSITQDVYAGSSPFNRVNTSSPGNSGNGYGSLNEWYYESGFNVYPFSFMLVNGQYDPTLGITYPVTPSAIPIPASLLLLAPALLGFMGYRRKLTKPVLTNE